MNDHLELFRFKKKPGHHCLHSYLIYYVYIVALWDCRFVTADVILKGTTDKITDLIKTDSSNISIGYKNEKPSKSLIVFYNK